MDSGIRTLTIIPVQTLNPIIPAKLRTVMPYQSVTILLLPFFRFPWFYIYFPSRALSSSAVGGHRAGARRGKTLFSSFHRSLFSGGSRATNFGSGWNRGRVWKMMTLAGKSSGKVGSDGDVGDDIINLWGKTFLYQGDAAKRRWNKNSNIFTSSQAKQAIYFIA